MEDERSIDELIEIAEEIPDKLGLGAGIAGLRGEARGEHVAVTVDVQGKIIALEIAEQAAGLGPDGLAAEIQRLTTEAGTAVLRDGLRAVRAGCVPAVADAIEAEVGPLPEVSAPDPAPSTSDTASAARRQEPPEDEDFFVLTPSS